MIWVVIPAYNEEKNIQQTIKGLLEKGYKNIVVVDDGSSDNTLQIAKKTGVNVLHHEINRGQGASLQTGHEYALSKAGEIIVDFDADGQFDPGDIALAIEKIRKENFDLVFGSRFLDGRSKIPWSKKKIILPIAKIINHLFSGVRLTDAHNGFRVFSRKALEKIKITQDKMAHNTEIVAQVKKNNFSFIEIPVCVRYSSYGQGIKGGFYIIKDLLINFFIK